MSATLAAAAALGLLLGQGAGRAASDTPAPAPATTVPAAPPVPAPVHPSRALGKPFAGRLVDGVQLPPEGADFFTWYPILKRSPNRDWRRYGTDRVCSGPPTCASPWP